MLYLRCYEFAIDFYGKHSYIYRRSQPIEFFGWISPVALPSYYIVSETHVNFYHCHAPKSQPRKPSHYVQSAAENTFAVTIILTILLLLSFSLSVHLTIGFNHTTRFTQNTLNNIRYFRHVEQCASSDRFERGISRKHSFYTETQRWRSETSKRLSTISSCMWLLISASSVSRMWNSTHCSQPYHNIQLKRNEIWKRCGGTEKMQSQWNLMRTVHLILTPKWLNK